MKRSTCGGGRGVAGRLVIGGLLDDQIAELVARDGLSRQDQRGRRDLLDHARAGDRVRSGDRVPAEHGHLARLVVRVEVHHTRASLARARLARARSGPDRLGDLAPVHLAGHRSGGRDPDRDDLQRRVQAERVDLQAAPLERVSEVLLGGSGGWPPGLAGPARRRLAGRGRAGGPPDGARDPAAPGPPGCAPGRGSAARRTAAASRPRAAAPTRPARTARPGRTPRPGRSRAAGRPRCGPPRRAAARPACRTRRSGRARPG